MQYLLVSDLHGDFNELEFIIKKFNDLKCEKIICLGDFLYHGPRNDLPLGYNPKKCVELLNKYKDKIIAINGNCDAEVDQMVLDFKLNKELSINLFGHDFYLVHGHHLDELKNMSKDTIVLHGHTHIFGVYEKDGITFVNPGSISIPRNGLPKTYALINEEGIKILDKNDNILLKFDFVSNH